MAKILRINEQKAIRLVSDILGTYQVYENMGVFDWLRGDKGTKLRVDAYYPSEGLVLEYYGAQHFKPNKLMDRRNGRREQRARYTELRQRLILQHGLKLLEIRYDENLTREHITEKLVNLGYNLNL